MAESSKVRVLAFPSDDFACGQWRIIQPAASMRDPRVEVRLGIGDVEVTDCDVVQFQRTLWPQQMDALRMVKRLGKKVVIDFDDAFPVADPAHDDYEDYAPGSPNARALEEALSLADAVTVPTPELVEHYGRMHPRVVLLPNAVDLEGPLYRPGPLGRVSEKLTVFWSGWKSHAANLRLVAPAVTRLLQDREDVVFVLCGPAEFVEIFGAARETERLLRVSQMPYETCMRAASMADVAIAPLESTPFNQNKSEIRLIEAGAWGVPAVASAVSPYSRFDGGQGACELMEGADPHAWYAAIARLLDDPTRREAMGRIARVAVATRYSLSAVNWKRAELWSNL